MFWKKKDKPRSSGWLYQIRDTSGLKFETQDDPDEISPKQALRIYNDDALKVFGSVYCEDNIVTDLTISGPEMTDFDPTYLSVDGFRILGNLIGSNTRLTSIKLSDHIIDYAAGMALAEGLSRSTTLENITLWKDRIDNDTGYGIVSYLLRIPTIRTINLGQNTLSIEGKDRIQALVASYNPAIVLKMF